MKLFSCVHNLNTEILTLTLESLPYQHSRYRSIIPRSGMLAVNEVRVNGSLVPFTLIGETIFIQSDPSQNILISGKEKG